MKALIRYCSFSLTLLAFTLNGFSQTRNCAAMDHLALLQDKYPSLQLRMQQIEDFTQQYIRQQGHTRSTITIPVVVHVVYRNNSQNISDAQVLSQIDVLNEDFRRMNADTSNTPSMFQGVAADAGIEFCLANTDPNGNPTNGITRTRTNKKSFSYNNDAVKFSSMGGEDAWPAGQYLNIWVCNLSRNLLGYAQFPGGPAATDGVVILYDAFGRVGNVTSPFDLGRTTTHEVGHWLNLRHIWGDGPCGYDDYVGDTPESDNPNYGCAWGHVSCGSTDMVQNYMDYSDDDCMNLFTYGQSSRMNALFAPGGYRESLLYSNGCGGSSPPPPTACSVPTGLKVTNITDNDAVLNWSAVTDAASYNVRARQTNTTTWATGNTTNASITYSSLTACTEYEFQVETVCSDGSSSGFSASQTFVTTGCAPTVCDAPTGLFVSNMSHKSARVNWDPVSGASSYEVEYREQGRNWRSKSTSDNFVDLNGLKNGRTYEWQVRTVCGSSYSAFSNTESFVFSSNHRVAADDVEFLLYPNPANDKVVIQLPTTLEGPVNIRLMDLAGKQYVSLKSSVEESSSIELDISYLPSGMYFIQLDDGNALNQIKKLLISR